jgi:hypothetical protein
MKTNILLGLTLIISLFACQSSTETTDVAGVYGDSTITTDGAIEASEVAQLLSGTDTINLKVKGMISSACQAKGCWMSMDMGNNQSLVVTFKDYGFFVPKNSADHQAIISGVAYKAVTSIADLKEKAKDSNKSQEEIDAISEEQVDFNFIADGVIIQ